MTGRDRLVVMGLAVLAVLAGGWLLIVSPERQQAAQQQAQVESAHQQLETAQTEATTARSAQVRYADDYSSVVSLGKAVPPLDEVPSLVYELDQVSNQRDVDFNSIATGSGSGSSAASAPSTTAVTAAAFTQMPFTFVFKGSFFGLARLFSQIDGFAHVTVRGGSTAGGHVTAADHGTSKAGGLQVSGRLLTIQGVDLTVESQGSSSIGGSQSTELTATITATAYVLPASQGLTAGATASGPATGPVGAGATQAASNAAASSSAPASPAVIQGTP